MDSMDINAEINLKKAKIIEIGFHLFFFLYKYKCNIYIFNFRTSEYIVFKKTKLKESGLIFFFLKFFSIYLII